MDVAVVIPARLGSRRFPRKVLARQTGKYLVEHVYERVAGCPGLSRVIIATDSEEVVEAGRSFGAEVFMTSPDHASGTDRVAEVARSLPHEIIVNVQGDEPLIDHADLETLVGLFEPRESRVKGTEAGLPEDVVMGTLVARRADAAGFHDPNVVKAVVSADGRAIYFSRAPVPHDRDREDTRADTEWYQHIGIYAYRKDFLLKITSLPPTPLERRERLEQLRVLEHGYSIRVGVSTSSHLGIDTEEEYGEFVAAYLKQRTKK